MATSETENPARAWENTVDRYFADLPWGVVVFLVLAIGGLVWTITGGLTADAYMAAVATGSGLLAVGHGVRTRGRGR
jgi:hypothetical protein